MAHPRSRHLGFGSLLCGVALGLLAGAAAAAVPTEVVTCGQNVDHSLRVANNLEDCPGHGLVVAADGITIDLGGHRIDGDGDDSGIFNIGHVGVTVRNGVVSGFQFGVNYSNNAQGTVTGMHAVGNAFGIGFSNSFPKSVIKKNVVSGNTVAGVSVFGTTSSVFQDNLVVGNALVGLHLFFCEGGTFTKNRISDNGSDGVLIQSARSTLQRNVVTGNALRGVTVISGSPENVLKKNVIAGNGSHGIAIDSGTDNRIEGNVVSGNDEDGIAVAMNAANTGNVIASNVANENGRHGISSAMSDLVLTGNRADRNGFLGGTDDDVGAGISVVAGTTNAKNKASGNDDPRQCLPQELSCAVPFM